MVDTISLGRPRGSPFMAKRPRAVPMVPPKAMIPSIFPSAESPERRIAAPLAMNSMLLLSFPSPITPSSSVSPALATSSRLMAGSKEGFPNTPQSITSGRCPRSAMLSMTYLASSPFVSRVAKIATVQATECLL